MTRIDANSLERRLRAGEIVRLSKAQWGRFANRFEVVERHDTRLAGELLLVRRERLWATVERPAGGSRNDLTRHRGRAALGWQGLAILRWRRFWFLSCGRRCAGEREREHRACEGEHGAYQSGHEARLLPYWTIRSHSDPLVRSLGSPPTGRLQPSNRLARSDVHCLADATVAVR